MMPLTESSIREMRKQFAHTIIGDYTILSNMGFTCYMNSFICSLFMTKKFREEVLDDEVPFNPIYLASNQKDQVTLLQELFYKMLKSLQEK